MNIYRKTGKVCIDSLFFFADTPENCRASPGWNPEISKQQTEIIRICYYIVWVSGKTPGYSGNWIILTKGTESMQRMLYRFSVNIFHFPIA